MCRSAGSISIPCAKRFCPSKGSMDAKQAFELLAEAAIVPVVRTTSADAAVQIVDALYRGGVKAAEITMTVPGAVRALERVADKLGNKILLGAGTVLDP